MKFIDFMEKRVDPFIKLSLTDLAKTLAEEPEVTFEFSFYSTYQASTLKVTASHYWSRLLDERKLEGMKSDVYLRAIGNRHFTDYQSLKEAWREWSNHPYSGFAKQLLSLIEDLRLERIIKKLRPGTRKAFNARQDLFYRRFRDRFTYHLNRKEWLDVLFCAIYLQWVERPIKLPDSLSSLKPHLRELTHQIVDLSSSESAVSLVQAFIWQLPDELADIQETYFMMDPLNDKAMDKEPFPGEKNALTKDRSLDLEEEPDTDSSQDSLPTWHTDQDQEGDSFLQFDIDEGASSDLLGEGERRAESGDQAFASLQGNSQQGNGNDYDELPPSQPSENPEILAHRKEARHSNSDPNRAAIAFFTKPDPPSAEMKEAYKQMTSQTLGAQKSLKRSIQKLIDYKKQAPRLDLHAGRLGKKLLRIITDEGAPRLFYKKQADSRDLDVTFSLLIDCSASMHDKMSETKVGITLFHESLSSLQIPHSITGFWEDALEATETKQPNYFAEVIDFESSLLPGKGASILSLEPEEDNRDGFAIREVAKRLSRRPETHKILLVFTDGEPSAFNYQDQGLVDTHQAVLEARKRGLDVIGILLADAYTQESEKDTLKHIYGQSRLVIPTAEEIPDVLSPLLRKLLTRYIH